MDFRRLKRGDRLHLLDGSSAEFVGLADGDTARVRRESGDEALVSPREVAAFSPAPPGPEWGERVTAVLHRVPETGGFEGGFEAVTMGGVPHGVLVTGSDPETAASALENLRAGLRAFGFSGTLVVDDATYIGGVNRYEVEVS